MQDLLQALLRALEDGQPAMLVSVLSASGSTPRGPGAAMAVFSDGSALGTVGGGNVEYEAVGLAKELLDAGQSALRDLRFTPGEAPGMVCGGELRLHFHFLPGGDPAALAVLRRLLEASGENGNCWLLRRLEGAEVRELRAAVGTDPRLPQGLPGGKAALAGDWFALPTARAGLVVLFGGGHVSQALAAVLDIAGFRYAVWDDRSEFASRERFPRAERLVCAPFEALSARLEITGDDYLVIMTRGHQADYTVLSQVLRSGAKYLGCIGSKKKLALCRERLLAEGFTAEEYARVHAPIGLAIGAETPAEIAVAVAAELIGVRAGVLVDSNHQTS